MITFALVGRPNVGKSALFNRLINQKIAITDEMEGVTRDRLYAEGEFFGKPFRLIDTGGISSDDSLLFNQEIREQSTLAIDEADVIIMVVDGRIGLTLFDQQVVKLLRKSKKPLILAINKMDREKDESYDFHPLGISHFISVSAAQGRNIVELLELAFSLTLNGEEVCPIGDVEEEFGPKLAILGRPNVGKSTLVNSVLSEKRCVVSALAGTTRDAIEVPFFHKKIRMTLIDTAGIRRKKSEKEAVDKFAALRTQRAIERSDICLLLIDAQEGLTHEEKKIINTVEEAGKGLILFVNKWDLVSGFRMEHARQDIRQCGGLVSHCPILFGSAKSGKGKQEIFEAVQTVREFMTMRISTGRLNQFIEQTTHKYHPPMIDGKRLRIYYLLQGAVAPPRFILFVNYPKRLTDSYKKYLINALRKEYSFTGAPLVFHIRGKKKQQLSHQNHGSEGSNIVWDEQIVFE